MATLLELSQIEVGATSDPGDPAAKNLRAKVKYAILRKAGTILAAPLPADETARGPALEQLAWAQYAVTNADEMTNAVFRLTLARSPTAATTTQILAATDQAIEDGISPVLAMLAKGRHPGAR